MAGIGVSSVVFLSLLLLVIGGSDASFLFPMRTVIVTGRLCCTETGNCPGNPVVGATVTLTCVGAFLNPDVVATNTTTATGAFSITATVNPNLLTNLFRNASCKVTVQLPVSTAAACPALSNTGGRLYGPVEYTSQVEGVLTGTVPAFIRWPF